MQASVCALSSGCRFERCNYRERGFCGRYCLVSGVLKTTSSHWKPWALSLGALGCGTAPFPLAGLRTDRPDDHLLAYRTSEFLGHTVEYYQSGLFSSS